jgi:hypothetical protein
MAAGQPKLPDLPCLPESPRGWSAQRAGGHISAVLIRQLALNRHAPRVVDHRQRRDVSWVSIPANIRTSCSCWSLPQPGKRRHLRGYVVFPHASIERQRPRRTAAVHDVSAFLGVPVGTLYQWRYMRVGPPAYRVGRHIRYDPSAVRTWLNTQDAYGR